MTLLISEEEAEERLERSAILYKRIGQGSNGNARPRGNFRTIPAFARELMAAEVRAGAKMTEIARAWGVSPTSVRYAKEGRDNGNALKDSNEELVQGRDQSASLIRSQIIGSTIRKLRSTIGSIKEDEIGALNPVQQTIVARNLGAVVEKLEPKSALAGSNVTYNVYVPTEIKIASFGEPIVIQEEMKKR